MDTSVRALTSWETVVMLGSTIFPLGNWKVEAGKNRDESNSKTYARDSHMGSHTMGSELKLTQRQQTHVLVAKIHL